MEREEGLKFMHDLLRALVARKGSGGAIRDGERVQFRDHPRGNRALVLSPTSSMID